MHEVTVQEAVVLLCLAMASRSVWATLWLGARFVWSVADTVVRVTKDPPAVMGHWAVAAAFRLAGYRLEAGHRMTPREFGCTRRTVYCGVGVRLEAIDTPACRVYAIYLEGHTDRGTSSSGYMLYRVQDEEIWEWFSALTYSAGHLLAPRVLVAMRPVPPTYEVERMSDPSAVVGPRPAEQGISSYSVGRATALPSVLDPVLHRCRTMLDMYRVYELRGQQFVHTFVLTGPPGTGKTHAVFTLASKLGLSVMYLEPTPRGLGNLKATSVPRTLRGKLRVSDDLGPDDVLAAVASRAAFRRAFETGFDGRVSRRDPDRDKDAYLLDPVHIYLFDDIDRFFSPDTPADVRAERAAILQEVLRGQLTPQGFVFLTVNDLSRIKELGEAVNRKGRAGDVYHVTREDAGPEILESILKTFFYDDTATPAQMRVIRRVLGPMTASEAVHTIGVHRTYDELCAALEEHENALPGQDRA